MATSVQGVGSELVLELHWLHARPKPVVKAVHRSLFLKVPLRVRDVYVTGPDTFAQFRRARIHFVFLGNVKYLPFQEH